MLIPSLIVHIRHRADLAPDVRAALLSELEDALRCGQLATAILARQGGIYPFGQVVISPHTETVHSRKNEMLPVLMGHKSLKAQKWDYVYSQRMKIYRLNKEEGISRANLARRFGVSERLIEATIKRASAELGKV